MKKTTLLALLTLALTTLAVGGASAQDSNGKVNYFDFKRVGAGAGVSLAGHDRTQAAKLDVNFGALQLAYYANGDYHRNIAALFAPEVPLFLDRVHPVSFVPGAGVQYNGKDSGVKMNVDVVAHVDVGLFKQFHLRAGPTFFIPTNAGDTSGIDGSDRRLAMRRPRGDVSLRVAF